MTGLKPHPEYKASGVDWLGDVPAHWEMVKLKHGFDLQKRPPLKTSGIVTAFRDGQVTLRANRRIDGYTEGDKQIGYQAIHPGDLVIHAMDAFAGAIGVSDSLGQSTPVYSVCTAKPGFNAHFYALALRHIALTGYISSLAKGVRERSTDFRWADAKELPVPRPPFEEQNNIVLFLARETAQIDDLIGKQERLIELLTEKRQAVIAHAVTKGLDPTAPTRPSGIPWLGNVPSHWEVKAMRYICKIGTGARDTVNAEPDGQFPFFVRSQTVERIGTSSFNCEAVLTAGDGAGVGKVFHHFEGQFDAHQRVYVMRDFEQVSGKFFYYFFSTLFAKVALDGSAKSTVDSLRRPILADFEFTIPPFAEQEDIVAYVDRKVSAYARLESTAAGCIELLKERRTALISAAVTGKIKVDA
ncbi:restriction endonuclease subunit S [Arthrobacter sp. B1I2]|uniref:restriction endonuclease subunit S n=1 Tax=Arthrobacter sp. B1I2 TaxID=3042263 RepID=UPI002789B4B1|nr:restriction endonuclease subunit S [Arthrobacter sp. B1I2]MDQ0733083.1 type I restriction enzyme S subunit [Arthrobacter sp. B1I2]